MIRTSVFSSTELQKMILPCERMQVPKRSIFSQLCQWVGSHFKQERAEVGGKAGRRRRREAERSKN